MSRAIDTGYRSRTIRGAEGAGCRFFIQHWPGNRVGKVKQPADNRHMPQAGGQFVPELDLRQNQKRCATNVVATVRPRHHHKEAGSYG